MDSETIAVCGTVGSTTAGGIEFEGRIACDCGALIRLMEFTFRCWCAACRQEWTVDWEESKAGKVSDDEFVPVDDDEETADGSDQDETDQWGGVEYDDSDEGEDD